MISIGQNFNFRPPNTFRQAGNNPSLSNRGSSQSSDSFQSAETSTSPNGIGSSSYFTNKGLILLKVLGALDPKDGKAQQLMNDYL